MRITNPTTLDQESGPHSPIRAMARSEITRSSGIQNFINQERNTIKYFVTPPKSIVHISVLITITYTLYHYKNSINKL